MSYEFITTEVKGRVALVTGGGSGLGEAAAARLRADGIRVITADVAEGADLRLDVSDDAVLRAFAVNRTGE